MFGMLSRRCHHSAPGPWPGVAAPPGRGVLNSIYIGLARETVSARSLHWGGGHPTLFPYRGEVAAGLIIADTSVGAGTLQQVERIVAQQTASPSMATDQQRSARAALSSNSLEG